MIWKLFLGDWDDIGRYFFCYPNNIRRPDCLSYLQPWVRMYDDEMDDDGMDDDGLDDDGMDDDGMDDEGMDTHTHTLQNTYLHARIHISIHFAKIIKIRSFVGVLRSLEVF